MNAKMSAPIKSISLNERTYHGVTITPSLINFFFGKNGAGKTTISDTIRKMIPEYPEYDILIYDREFIAKNIKEDEALPGVFSVNEEDIEKQNQIDEWQKQLHELGLQYSEKKSAYDSKKGMPEVLRANLMNSCWKHTQTMRSDFIHTMDGKRGSKSAFLDELLKVRTTKEADLEALKNLYDTAYSSDSTRYPRLQTVKAPNEKNMPGFSLLDTAIISSSTKPFATFIRTIGAADWLHQGHEQFSENADGRCPYCGRSLPENFEEQYALCFDKQFETDMRTLRSFIAVYESAVDNIVSVLEKNTGGAHPKIIFDAYNDKLDTLRAIVDLNKRKLNDKTAAPTSLVSIDSIDALIGEINEMINAFNKIIDEHNTIIASRQRKQAECKNAVWQHMAFQVADDVESYKTSLTTVNTELKQLHDDMQKLIADGNVLKKDISELSKQISGVDSAMESINKMLFDSGFQGFSLQKKGAGEEDKNKYMIVRDDQKPAHGLSEGERNFIAFLYFYHKVLGKETSDGNFKDRIVVIDDPVSSMDSSSLFIVSAIVRELLGICFNHGCAANPDAPKFIRQMFVLTHNAYFHREVSYDKIKYFHCVNIYLVKKHGNVSTIELCTKKEPFSKEPAIEHNFNPVQNAYAMLWHEYDEITSANALTRVIRQILEYYFIQISGYEGASLREQILKDESVFIRENPDGTENKDLLQSVNALLRYIGSDRYGFNDGMDYIDGMESVDAIKDTFRRIFIAMGQEQHYRMMMDAIR